MNSQVELLVHIGAPSNRRDDETYSNQARAYLGFQGRVIDGSSHSGENVRTGLPPLNEDESTYIDDTQLAYKALDSQLVTSSLVIPPFSPEQDESHGLSQNPSTTCGAGKHFSGLDTRSRVPSSYLHSGSDHKGVALENQKEDQRGCAALQRSRDLPTNQAAGLLIPAQADDDEQSQSSYLKSPILNRASKKRRLTPDPRLERPSHYIAPANPPSLEYVVQQPHVDAAAPENNKTHKIRESLISNETTSELPTSYSLSDITSESSRAKAKRDGSQRSVSDPGPKTGSSKVEAVRRTSDEGMREQIDGSTAQVETTETQRRTIQSHKLSGADVSSKTVADASHKSNKAAPAFLHPTTTTSQPRTKAVSTSPKTISTHLSNTIQPPPPPTGIQTYTTHITSELQYLADRPSLAQTYNPISTTRQLQPLERGYWLLDCGNWPEDAQVEFWEFLGRIVGSGRAGWGVWCERDEGWKVKVFCWGEIVRHVWLLVYMASKSRVRKCGAIWVDGGGEVVVRMRER